MSTGNIDSCPVTMAAEYIFGPVSVYHKIHHSLLGLTTARGVCPWGLGPAWPWANADRRPAGPQKSGPTASGGLRLALLLRCIRRLAQESFLPQLLPTPSGPQEWACCLFSCSTLLLPRWKCNTASKSSPTGCESPHRSSQSPFFWCQCALAFCALPALERGAFRFSDYSELKYEHEQCLLFMWLCLCPPIFTPLPHKIHVECTDAASSGIVIRSLTPNFIPMFGSFHS